MIKITEDLVTRGMASSVVNSASDENSAEYQMKNLETMEVIDELFDRLMAIFPAFKQAWPTERLFNEAKKEWLKAFMRAKIDTVEKIKFGLDKFRLLETPFVPSPGQFIAMCNPTFEEIGLPAVHVAYKEACEKSHPHSDRSNWSHEAVYDAAYETGFYNLRSLSMSESYKLFDYNYHRSCDKYLNGGNLREIPAAIEYKANGDSTPEVAKRGFANLKDILGIRK